MTPRLRPDFTSRLLAWLTGRPLCLCCGALVKPDLIVEHLCLPCHVFVKRYLAEQHIALIHPLPCDRPKLTVVR